jgi:hypothetical protein
MHNIEFEFTSGDLFEDLGTAEIKDLNDIISLIQEELELNNLHSIVLKVKKDI